MSIATDKYLRRVLRRGTLRKGTNMTGKTTMPTLVLGNPLGCSPPPRVHVWLEAAYGAACVVAEIPGDDRQIIATVNVRKGDIRLTLPELAPHHPLLDLAGNKEGEYILPVYTADGKRLVVPEPGDDDDYGSGMREAPVGRFLTDEQVHAIEDAAAKRALEYAARRMDELSKTTSGARVDHVPVMIRAMTEGVWRFRADSQGKEPEA